MLGRLCQDLSYGRWISADQDSSLSQWMDLGVGLWALHVQSDPLDHLDMHWLGRVSLVFLLMVMLFYGWIVHVN